jgi:hypothetical protein
LKLAAAVDKLHDKQLPQLRAAIVVVSKRNPVTAEPFHKVSFSKLYNIINQTTQSQVKKIV